MKPFRSYLLALTVLLLVAAVGTAVITATPAEETLSDAELAAQQALAEANMPTQLAPVPYDTISYRLDSREVRSLDTEAGVAFRQVLREEGAAWLQINFGDVNLGNHGKLVLRSLEDGGDQTFTRDTLASWYNASAYFNGDAVEISLLNPKNEADLYATIDTVNAGLDQPPATQSICGDTDDRVATGEVRVGRIMPVGCTAWLIPNGTLLTAGHCIDLDPDRGGPLLPDGNSNVAANWVVEFNVPASNANGTTNPSDPDDQYSIVMGNERFGFDGEGQGLGKDWAVIEVERNTNTGETPHGAQGSFYRVSFDNPSNGDNTRIRGFGVDDGTANQTNQTHDGPYVEEQSSGANFWHRYQADTTGGNSGSPIQMTSNFYTIGIHTNAGCGADFFGNPSGANSGTSFSHDPVEIAIDNFFDNDTLHTDVISPFDFTLETGSMFAPFRSFRDAVASANNGFRINLTPGSYDSGSCQSSPIVVNESVRIVSPAGAATICN